jgi:glycogen operon protein
MRCYWKGDTGLVPRLASRLSGSQDIFGSSRRVTTASVNFLTSHDGFTLRDLVSYNNKHNEANKEGNRDGDDHNNSWNCGVEGPTDDKKILNLRARMQRSLLATLFISQGVPMLLAGDEFGRSQGGNNNAYCQDNEVSWIDWNLDKGSQSLLQFTRKLITLRREHPIFRRIRFFNPEPRDSYRPREIIWFTSEGYEMGGGDWGNPHNHCLGLGLHGHTEESGHTLSPPPGDITFLLLFNAYEKPVDFRLAGRDGVTWKPLINTSNSEGKPASAEPVPCGQPCEVRDRSLLILTLADGSEKDALYPCVRR